MTEPTDDIRDEKKADDVTDQDAADVTEDAPTEADTDTNSEPPEVTDEVAADVEEADTEAAPEEKSEPAEKPAKKSGGILVWLVLLLALGGLGGVGYLYYELIHKDPQGQLRSELAATSSDASAQFDGFKREVSDRLATMEGRQSEALAQALSDTDARLASAEEGFAASLNQVINTAPPSEREWKLAEAAYLLRVANHRLIMEQDVRAAMAMLEATDQILAELDDFALHRVRAALADEMMALKRVRGSDIQGLYLTLEAIKNQLGSLPIALPEYLAEEPAEVVVSENADFWQVVSTQFFSLFSFREVGRDGVRPLLAPDEAIYLEQNIRLTLEQAQLAALKRHQAVYEAALTNARAWVSTYLAGDSEDVANFVNELDALLAIDLEQPMPDISASFAALNDVLRGVLPAEDGAAEPAEEQAEDPVEDLPPPAETVDLAGEDA